MNSVYRQNAEPRIDWFRVLADLSRNGLGERGVARRIRVSKTTINGWKQGAEPRHSDGERLIALWCERLAQVRGEVPMHSPYDWR